MNKVRVAEHCEYDWYEFRTVYGIFTSDTKDEDIIIKIRAKYKIDLPVVFTEEIHDALGEKEVRHIYVYDMEVE